uniref:Uncharacterized protein n=1 Tax=viral metagenome TaxID=1070528 RepID=A0A6C0KQY3_9ZZZZ
MILYPLERQEYYKKYFYNIFDYIIKWKQEE